MTSLLQKDITQKESGGSDEYKDGEMSQISKDLSEKNKKTYFLNLHMFSRSSPYSVLSVIDN